MLDKCVFMIYNYHSDNTNAQKYGGDTMSEEAKKNLETISEKLKDIPKEVAEAAIDQYAARMEGFAEGFAAGKAHAENKPQ